MYRARHTWDLAREFIDVSSLGPPSAAQAVGASRMSPAGIPVFYGALDLDTAIEETLAHAGAGGTRSQVKVCWGSFRTISPLTVIDLTSLPQVPGFFSPHRSDREALAFLHDFTSDVARPIPADGREHSEYAPTQVVAEYFRHVYKSPDGRPVDGILYPSSKTGGRACVLFIGRDRVCSEAEWSGEDEPHRLFLEAASPECAVYSVRWESDPEASN